jgi:hypothetical protein
VLFVVLIHVVVVVIVVGLVPVVAESASCDRIWVVPENQSKFDTIPEIKTDPMKVTRSLDRLARLRLPSGIIGMPATWVDRSSSSLEGDTTKHEDLQHYLLF